MGGASTSHMTRRVNHVTKYVYTSSVLISDFVVAANGSDLTIAVFVWGCGDSAQREWLVGVFDLNQYYHSQVPKQLYWKTTGKHTGYIHVTTEIVTQGDQL